jgi:hypothetical protein
VNVEGLSIGRIVHYVMPDDCDWVDFNGLPVSGQHYPAIIVGIEAQNEIDAIVNLHVFHNAPSAGFRDRVYYSDEKTSGTWHWPERV